MSESVRFTLVVFLLGCAILTMMYATGMWFVSYVPGESVTIAFGPVNVSLYPDMFPAHNR